MIVLDEQWIPLNAFTTSAKPSFPSWTKSSLFALIAADVRVLFPANQATSPCCLRLAVLPANTAVL
jgi:hypothetical protein